MPRPKPIKINGTSVKIIRSRRNIFDFKIITRGSLRFSDIEKTLLNILATTAPSKELEVME